MTLFKMPLFEWSFYSTSWLLILAPPVIGITFVLLILERSFGIGIFDPVLGGDPLLYQHLFWIYSHPAVYIMVLPAMGIVSEIIPTFARKNIFELDFTKYNTSSHPLLKKLVGFIFYVVEYVLLFPVFTFFWFIVFSVLLSFMAKSQVVGNILLVSIALVSAVRLAAYYDEDLSKDLAKMLPFALLGIFLVDISYFSFSTSIETLKLIPSFWKTMVYYLVFAIVLEFILRIGYGILKPATDISK